MTDQERYTVAEREEIEALRAELADRFEQELLEDSGLEDLRQLKEEIDADDALYEFAENEWEQFQSTALRTRAQIIERVTQAQEAFQSEARSPDRTKPAAYYQTMDQLLYRFLLEVKTAPLIEPLPEWWFYTVEVTETGAFLYLVHCNWEASSTTSCLYENDYCFTMIHQSARRMNVGEYAKMYGVRSAEVRDWIQRGQIRAAELRGKAWYIPGLCLREDPERHRDISFSWETLPDDIPEKYQFLKAFKKVEISQNEGNGRISARFALPPYDKQLFPCDFSRYSRSDRKKLKDVLSAVPDTTVARDGSLRLSRQQAEELEGFLIATPGVRRGLPNGQTLATWGGEYFTSGEMIYIDLL